MMVNWRMLRDEIWKWKVLNLILLLALASCSGETKTCEFSFEIEVKSSNSFSYNSSTGSLRKLINPFKKEIIFADTTYQFSKDAFCDLMRMVQSYKIMEYPNEFRPESDIRMDPSPSYLVKFTVGNETKEISWKENTEIFNTIKANNFKKVLNKIENIILSSAEFQSLPEGEYYWE